MTETELYDVVIPPGVPVSIFQEIADRFPQAKVVESRHRLFFANMEGDERDLLAFRADLETAKAIEEFLYERLNEFIEEEASSRQSG